MYSQGELQNLDTQEFWFFIFLTFFYLFFIFFLCKFNDYVSSFMITRQSMFCQLIWQHCNKYMQIYLLLIQIAYKSLL